MTDVCMPLEKGEKKQLLVMLPFKHFMNAKTAVIVLTLRIVSEATKKKTSSIKKNG